ncbi:hypothetical protein V6N13_111515 [Hibiscus sabdariffa]|uniref:Precursor of CEP9 n=1 Tax=Hibiscus sabdariffa TaxID=183260 RepID=A0ABR2TKI9_9ROSI
MHKFVVFLVIAFHLVLSVEGRLLKSVSKNDSKQVLPPPTPTKTSDFVDSVEGYEEDFRPTTPGNSPGGGHSFAGDDERSVGQKPGTVNGKHSVAGDKDDFRPTTPGNSPGAGHSFQEDDEDIERKPGHSIAGAKQDFRPSGDHVYGSQISEPNA